MIDTADRAKGPREFHLALELSDPAGSLTWTLTEPSWDQILETLVMITAAVENAVKKASDAGGVR